MKKLLLTLIFLNIIAPLLAQTSLRNLILNSDYIIVLGDSSYTEVEEELPNDSQIHQSWVIDTIGCEFIKGNITESKIKINRNFDCVDIYPDQPDHIPNIRILFIKKISTHYILMDDGFMDPHEIPNFKQIVTALSLIGQIDDEKLKFEKTVDWIIPSIEKDDGNADDLDSNSLFIQYYKQRGVIKDGAYLNEGQKLRLKNYIFSEPPSYAKLLILDLIYQDFKEEIYDKLLGYIKTLNPKEDDYLIHRCMQRSLNDNDPEALKEMVDEFYDAGTKRKKKIIKTFLRSKSHK